MDWNAEKAEIELRDRADKYHKDGVSYATLSFLFHLIADQLHLQYIAEKELKKR